MAKQIFADFYGCNEKVLNSQEEIKRIAAKAIHEIGAEIVDECVHIFEPIGITYFAVITTSHFSIHTWPEHGYAAVDVFSCGDEVTEGIVRLLKEEFEASEIKIGNCERIIGKGLKEG
ncbi:MAG: adenosylmethionine decarboxylase [Eubacterium sp.]|nr:adenosylmethionine decarboxylase [Eubacterium sp.]